MSVPTGGRHTPFRRADIHPRLFDHSIGLEQDFAGNRNAQRLRSLSVDHQLELRRLLNSNVGRLRAFQYLVGQLRGTTDLIAEKRAVGHERSVFSKFAAESDHRQPPAGREPKNLFALPLEKKGRRDENGFDPILDERRDRGVEFPDFFCNCGNYAYAERRGRLLDHLEFPRTRCIGTRIHQHADSGYLRQCLLE